MSTSTTEKTIEMEPIEKDPDGVADYPFEWEDWLAEPPNTGDTIASVAFSISPEVEGGLEISSPSPSHSDITAVVWLSGGVLGKTYKVRCRITTAGGRVQDATRLVRMVAQ